MLKQQVRRRTRPTRGHSGLVLLNIYDAMLASHGWKTLRDVAKLAGYEIYSDYNEYRDSQRRQVQRCLDVLVRHGRVIRDKDWHEHRLKWFYRKV